MSASVEELASSLVREYLSRKGLKQTLGKMDEELPRTADSISNRGGLARAIHIEKLMKRNKENSSPLRTMVEVITKYLMERPLSSSQPPQQSTATNKSHTEALNQSGGLRKSSLSGKRSLGLTSGENPLIRAEITPRGGLNVAACESERPRSRPLGDPILSTLALSKSRQRGMESRRCGVRPRNMAEWELDHQHVDEKCTSDVKADNKRNLDTSNTVKTQATSGDMQCEDLEDFDLNPAGHVTSPADPFGRLKTVGQPIPLETAKLLRELLFGSASGPSFNSEWRRQDFTFCDLPGLEYGLVQHEGGPCGILACVQAYVLKHLLFKDSKSDTEQLCSSTEERNTALISALADILWKVGRQQKRAVVALPASRVNSVRLQQSRSYTPDHLTERVVLYSFTDQSALREFLASHVMTFQQEGSSGCIHFLLSVLLSKGIESIRSDMDDRGGSLMGRHNYCTQEMVNLLLTGDAVSNVFNGRVSLDAGDTHNNLLRGISEPGEIGFLSLFEHYGNCIVGSHYKEPVYPIWVVCSESHFTILFSKERNLLTFRKLDKFDLFYFDGLANQDEEIRLTLDTTAVLESTQQKINCELVPPLQLCIQTKWKNAVVDWNSTEPLL